MLRIISSESTIAFVKQSRLVDRLIVGYFVAFYKKEQHCMKSIAGVSSIGICKSFKTVSTTSCQITVYDKILHGETNMYLIDGDCKKDSPLYIDWGVLTNMPKPSGYFSSPKVGRVISTPVDGVLAFEYFGPPKIQTKGMKCCKCLELNEYIEQGNQANGSYKCYRCRN